MRAKLRALEAERRPAKDHAAAPVTPPPAAATVTAPVAPPAGRRRAGSQDRRPRDRGRAPEERARPPRQQGAQAALRLRPRGVEGLPGRSRPLDRRLRRVQPAELRERQAGSAESLRRRALRALHGLQVHGSHHHELRARVRARRRRERHGRRGRGRVPDARFPRVATAQLPDRSHPRPDGLPQRDPRAAVLPRGLPPRGRGADRADDLARGRCRGVRNAPPGPRLSRVRAERHDGERVLQRKCEPAGNRRGVSRSPTTSPVRRVSTTRRSRGRSSGPRSGRAIPDKATTSVVARRASSRSSGRRTRRCATGVSSCARSARSRTSAMPAS